MTLQDAMPDAAADALRTLAAQSGAPCDSCSTLPRSGWEALPGGLDRTRLQPLGLLPAPDSIDDQRADATLDEYHAAGTRYWSPDAPIALGWFPYNRCTAWRCSQCGTVFLRYTEYGGYYEEERIRRVTPELVVAPARP